MKLVWTIHVNIDGRWRIIPGYWDSIPAAEAAYRSRMKSFQKRNQIPTDYKLISKQI